jgi:MYXO-CTERM domain-containing protein
VPRTDAPFSPFCSIAAFTVAALTGATAHADVPVAATFTAPDSADQDDMAIWLHPDDAGQSVVITSDKANGNLVVHALDGSPRQTVALTQPGNIDIRHDVPWGDDCADVVVVNERVDEVFAVFRVDPSTAELVRIDAGDLAVGGNYGLALHLADDGTLSGFTGPEGDTTVRRWTLAPTDDGGVQSIESDWSFSATQIEGMVADDDADRIFIGEENHGIWSLSISDSSDVTLVAEIGDDSGLAGDVEGLTIYHRARGGYLIASSQGADKYTVFDRMPPHPPLGEFRIAGVGSTDGIDVINVALGDAFPGGLFTAHNGSSCCPVVGASWSDVAQEAGLEVDVAGWTPRRGCDGAVGESGSEGDDGDSDDGATAEEGPADGSDDDAGDVGSDDDGSASAAPTSAGDSTDDDGGVSDSAGSSDDDDAGCGCAADPGKGSVAVVGLVLAIGARRRRRRRGLVAISRR